MQENRIFKSSVTRTYGIRFLFALCTKTKEWLVLFSLFESIGIFRRFQASEIQIKCAFCLTCLNSKKSIKFTLCSMNVHVQEKLNYFGCFHKELFKFLIYFNKPTFVNRKFRRMCVHLIPSTLQNSLVLAWKKNWSHDTFLWKRAYFVCRKNDAKD